ncbi:MAG: hypothetical protein ACKN9T_08010 [Candidatus Methylumidiphilus sp.]
MLREPPAASLKKAKVEDQGVFDLDGVSRATGACSGCGACDMDVLALVAEYSTLLARSATCKGQGGAD